MVPGSPWHSVQPTCCYCEEAHLWIPAKTNKFLRSEAVTETLRAPQKRRSHVEGNIKSSIPDVVTYTTITQGSPHGLQVTKTQGKLTMDE